MVEKNYYSTNAYTPESACEFIDSLLAIEKSFIVDIATGTKDFDAHLAGVMDGICIAIAAFGEANGVIPYSNETDSGFVEFAIEDGNKSLNDIANEMTNEMTFLSDDCDEENEGDDFSDEDDKSFEFVIDPEYFEDPKDFERLKNILLAFAEVK